MTKSDKKLGSLLKPIVATSKAKEIIEQTSSSPLYKTVFRQAEMYNRAYLMLKLSMDESKILNLVSPMLMNLCFSIELLMKAFILFERKNIFDYSELPNQGRDIYGHKYSILFGKIKYEHREAILEELSNKLDVSKIDESVFKQILINQNCDNSFAEWRYIFEEAEIKSLNTELLMTLNDIMGKQLLKLIENEE